MCLCCNESEHSVVVDRKLQPSSRERTEALTSALSEILWRAGNNKTATVAL